MLSFGFEPHVAVATNMLSLIFFKSLGGTLPFLKGDRLPRNRLWLLIAMTLAGSLLGAWLLLVVPSKTMPLVIAVALIVVTIFSLTNRKAGLTATAVTPSSGEKAAGIACTFLLGIYGGFFSGGYVALLTTAFVAFFTSPS
jgi:uncharacterized membrane protein YfcA